MHIRLTVAMAATTLLLLPGTWVVGQDQHAKDADDHHYFSKTEHEHAAEWGYRGRIGPEFWGTLSSDYRLAAEGRRQSPIDIPLSDVVARDLPALEFDYQDESLTVINNGHTIQHDEQPGSFLHVGNRVYALEQFHVHLPSEHTIDGEHADLEIHFVHKSESGQVAVVAVMVNAGTEAAVDVPPIHIPDAPGVETAVLSGRHNPVGLIPPDHAYVAYSGSFTTPPCTEGVRWIVMTTPIQATAQTIDRLRKSTGGNNRPVQGLFDRQILIGRNLTHDE